MTSLIELVRKDDYEAVKARLETEEGKLESRTTDKNGSFPLHWACKQKNASAIVLLLIEAYPVAAEVGDTRYGNTPLHLACNTGLPLDVLQALLAAYPAAVKVKNKRTNNLLYLACKTTLSTSDAIQALLATAGVIDTKYSDLPLHLACNNTLSTSDVDGHGTWFKKSIGRVRPMVCMACRPSAPVVDDLPECSNPCFSSWFNIILDQFFLPFADT
jgi:ankyrin repeat protein